MRVVGITGTSGSGKSTVSAWLAAQGYPVIDGDAVTRELATPGSAYVKALVKEFGASVCDEQGNLLRRSLGERAFATPDGQKRLTAVTMPLILREIKGRIAAARAAGAELLFLDGALIIDTPFEPLCDSIVAVLSDRETQARRIALRDGVSQQAALDRLDRQAAPETLRARADFVLENTGTRDELLQKAGRLLQQLKG